jgi:hypothetical protein
MGYDPCMPRSPVAPVAKPGHVFRHHRVRHLLGRRVARSHGAASITDACPKTARALPQQGRIGRMFEPLANPGVLTVGAMGVVGATAFGGLTMMGPATVPVVSQPPGTSPGKTTTGMTTPPGGPGSGTSVPEPGTAALLGLAMAVVLVSSWVQGGRALRARAQSDIASGPLPNRRTTRGAEPGRPQAGSDEVGDL